MSHGHPLRDLARGVQDELSRDPSIEAPKYMWCLGQVHDAHERAKELAAAERGSNVIGRKEWNALMIVKLVDIIKPKARKVSP